MDKERSSSLNSQVSCLMVKPMLYAPIHQSLKEVSVRAGYEVLTEVDNISLPVGNPLNIFGQIHLLNLIVSYSN
jgi:hypothetical protein